MVRRLSATSIGLSATIPSSYSPLSTVTMSSLRHVASRISPSKCPFLAFYSCPHRTLPAHTVNPHGSISSTAHARLISTAAPLHKPAVSDGKILSKLSSVPNSSIRSASTTSDASNVSNPGSRGPTAMVFMNMGGPSTLGEVGDFLTRLFSDPDIIPLGKFQKYIGPWISRRRTPKITTQYAAIGGGSPIRRWSEHQAAEMCKILDTESPDTAPHKPYVAFRYANPLTKDTYEQLLKDGFGGGTAGNGGRVVAFSQYPQYSCSTTGSSLNEIWKWQRRLEARPNRATGVPAGTSEIKWSVIDRWPTHPGLIDAVVERIEAGLATYTPEERDSVVLLFSAHSLPMSIINRGDPYPAEVAATVHAVMQRFKFRYQHRLVWQSQVGPSAWMGPQTSEVVPNYVAMGQKNLLLVPIAFTSDHIETLYELDEEIIKEADCSGVRRVESLNGSKVFIRALADVALSHLEELDGSGKVCSQQMKLRCPGCKSERCAEQKKFFANQQTPLIAV